MLYNIRWLVYNLYKGVLYNIYFLYIKKSLGHGNTYMPQFPVSILIPALFGMILIRLSTLWGKVGGSGGTSILWYPNYQYLSPQSTYLSNPNYSFLNTLSASIFYPIPLLLLGIKNFHHYGLNIGNTFLLF